MSTIKEFPSFPIVEAIEPVEGSNEGSPVILEYRKQVRDYLESTFEEVVAVMQMKLEEV